MLAASEGRLGPLGLEINSFSRAQNWKEAKYGSSESNFSSLKFLALSQAVISVQASAQLCFLHYLNPLPVGSAGHRWVGFVLFVASVTPEKMASNIFFIKNLGLTSSFCFCLLLEGRINP